MDASKWASDFSGAGGWNKIWPNSNFFKTVFADPGVPVLVPRMSINGPGGERFVNMGPGGVHWDYRPNADNISIKVAQQRGRHYVKFGVDTRGSYTSCLFGLNNPGFPPMSSRMSLRISRLVSLGYNSTGARSRRRTNET